MRNENHELNLLASVSKTLTENTDPNEIIQVLERIFNKFGRTSNRFVELKSMNLYIYDENTKTLRDFAKSWIVIEENANAYNNKLYQVLNQLSQYDFFVNGTPYKIEEITNYQNIKTNNDGNSILFPLRRKNRPFGILELTFPLDIQNLLDQDFFVLLSIASYQISLKIQNSILTEQMQKNIDFHKSMKEIAKIIETQYELNYIIPIIGEMIDRFVSNHLIYVFLKSGKEGPFTLVWPNACRDNNVYEYLNGIDADSKYALTENEKVGVFPLIGKNELLGCIVAHSTTNKLSDKEIEYLDQLSKQSSITIQRANAYAEVLQHATLDALTGLNNRRQFDVRLKQELSTAKRQEKPLCAIMLDVDFFKKVNDTYGHIAGDNVLKAVSGVIKSEIREYDIASRYGGEEFVILLPYTKIEEAYAVAQRLRIAVEKAEIFPDPISTPELKINVTVSIGVYQYTQGDNAQTLYDNADKALYQAKTHGRNKVVVYK